MSGKKVGQLLVKGMIMTTTEKVGIIASAVEEFFKKLREENNYSYREINDLGYFWDTALDTIEEKIAAGNFYT